MIKPIAAKGLLTSTERHKLQKNEEACYQSILHVFDKHGPNPVLVSSYIADTRLDTYSSAFTPLVGTVSDGFVWSSLDNSQIKIWFQPGLTKITRRV